MRRPWEALFLVAVAAIAFALVTVILFGSPAPSGSTSQVAGTSSEPSISSQTAEAVPVPAEAATTEDTRPVLTAEDINQEEVHADYIIANSLEEKVRSAPLIVIGEITGTGEVVNMARNPANPSQPSDTLVILGQVYRLKIERYVKGNGAATLNVIQPEGFIAGPREQRVALPTTQAAIDRAKTGYEYIPLRTGARYMFFITPVKELDPARNYVSGAAGHPWVFDLPSGGTAQPHTAVKEAAERFPARPAAALLGEVEQLIRSQR